MLKKRFLFFSFFLVLCYICVHWLTRVQGHALPTIQLNLASQPRLVDALEQQGLPLKGYLHAAVATDRANNFYVLTSKQMTAGQLPGIPESVTDPKMRANYKQAQQHIVHVLVADARGQNKRLILLRRLDGRPVRSSCEQLVVSPSGERIWTLRWAQESVNDWRDRDEVLRRTVLLNAYNSQGTPLGEWSLPDLSSLEVLLWGAHGNSAYLHSEGSRNLSIYTIEVRQPQQRPVPTLWRPWIGNSLVTSDLRFWHFSPNMDNRIQVFAAPLNGEAQLYTTFEWPNQTSPYLVSADSKLGLIVFEWIKNEKGQRPEDGAKIVYRVAPDGTVHKLFETPDVLQTRRGEEVRAGQLLNADANFVWMEATYLKDGQVTEYQIVKIPIS